MTMTTKESAARHMAAGVMDLDELARLVEQDSGRAPNSRVLSSYRSYFRRYGEAWIEADRERSRLWKADNPEKNSEANRHWKAENREKRIEACRRWEARYPARAMLNFCRGSAKRRGLDFALTAEDIEAMLAPMVCSATGLPLSLEHDGESARNPWAPSIDRIDCSKGYVLGNVRVVCVLYNLARNDFPDEAVMTMAKALAGRTRP